MKNNLITPLDKEELNRFLEEADKNLKHALMFRMGYYYGMRSGEIARIRLEDIDIKKKKITIKGLKGGTKKTYKIPDKIFKLLKKWLKERGVTKNIFLFPHRFEKNESITRIGVQKLFYQICERAGIKGHHIHNLRHSVGTELARRNWSENRIAAWLRQSSPTSARKYIDLTRDKELEDDMINHFDNDII